jgi:hypothetical protein
MLLYTEKQLDEAWRFDCKKRSQRGLNWLPREQYRDIFEAVLDLDNEHLTPAVQALVQDIDIAIPQEMLDTIQDAIDIDFDHD